MRIDRGKPGHLQERPVDRVYLSVADAPIVCLVAVTTMPVPTTTADLVTLIRRSRLLADDQLDPYAAAATPAELAEKLKGDGLLTPFQAEQLLRGRHKGFI